MCLIFFLHMPSFPSSLHFSKWTVSYLAVWGNPWFSGSLTARPPPIHQEVDSLKTYRECIHCQQRIYYCSPHPVPLSPHSPPLLFILASKEYSLMSSQSDPFNIHIRSCNSYAPNFAVASHEQMPTLRPVSQSPTLCDSCFLWLHLIPLSPAHIIFHSNRKVSHCSSFCLSQVWFSL